MRVTWLVAAPIAGQEGAWTSPLASIRYRVLPAAAEMRRQGHTVSFFQATSDVGGREDGALAADVVVVSKVLAASSAPLAERAQRLGSRVIVDLCDDHFETPDLKASYHALCRMADRIVASTAAMAEVVERKTGRAATIVDDPYEAPAGTPAFAPGGERLRLLWFGHPVNFDTVEAMLPSLGRCSRELPLALEVVTQVSSALTNRLAQAEREFGPGLRLRATAWSPAATWKAMEECDLVLVPSLPVAQKQVKSPNRVVEPIRRGRFVIAYPLPAYVELGEFVFLHEDMREGIRWAVESPAEAVRRLIAGQAYINERFCPQVVGRKWSAILAQAADAPPRAA